jgi:hypothetical protein
MTKKRKPIWTVTGYDAADKLLWGPVNVEALNADVARMEAIGALRWLPQGEELLARTERITETRKP